MKPFKRKDRISKLVLQILAEIVNNLVKDPRVHPVVFTRVEMADDLRTARVFYRILGGDPAATAAGLDTAAGFLRKELGARLRIKFTPDLRFVFDDAQERVERVERILESLRLDKPTPDS